MFDKIDLAIIFPDPSSQDILQLKFFFEQLSLKVATLPYLQSTLDQVVESKIRTIIVFNENNSHFSQDFIIEASIRKIFYQTTFYHLSTERIMPFDQVRLMTLGFSGFLTLPFNATDVQNTVDLTDCLIKAA